MTNVIKSCRDKETARILAFRPSRRFQAIQESAEEVMAMLNAATSLMDLALPGLRLEKLSGDRKGQYSVRINRQYRICFEWHSGDAFEVEIVDYH